MENQEVLQTLDGTIEHITYKNSENGYTVATLKNGKQSVIVVGELLFINEGDVVSLTGEYIVHPTYGQQFKVLSAEKKMPTTAASILRYLASGSIKGVGPSTAQRIVERFGDRSLEVIEYSPEELAMIRGISPEKAQKIGEEYKRQFGVREIMLILGRFGVSAPSAIKVYKVLGDNAVVLIQENPYILCNEKIDFPFELAEEIAESFGIGAANKNRICAGVEYVLRKNLMNGHTCLPREKVLEVSSNLLSCEKDDVSAACDTLINVLRITSKEVDGAEFLSLGAYYNAENFIAAKLTALNNYSRPDITVDPLEIDYIEQRMKVELDEAQRDAVLRACRNGIFILTGGPGTGKTTTLNAIIELFERKDIRVELAAPTGRAAKRMSELTGKEAKTIHRLLEVEWGEGDKQQFSRNEKNPLSCDVIIVDEMSMVDVPLFEGLLRALKLNCRIILVGDVDQLPSVGAGNVLNDIIDSGLFDTCKLHKIFRQAGQSDIVKAAHSIISGEAIRFTNRDTDLFFLRKNDVEDACRLIYDLYTGRLPESYGYVPQNDIQILCPSRKTALGTVNLNGILQSAVNPQDKGKKEVYYKGAYIRESDKVMQIKNNYDIGWVKDDGETGGGIFNGDIGTVEKIDTREGFMKVRFDDRVATYYSEDYGELEPAYAVTIHKSQGSEFECVILPLLDTPSLLRYRNLLYTAVTRAKKMLIIVGSEAIFNQMIENNKKTLRYTLLKTILWELNNEA